MKRLIFIILIFFTGNLAASSLPNCPSDPSERYHNCFGTGTSSNGGRYVGEFKDNKINGQGTVTWGKGSEWAGDKYVGEFKDNKMNGQGTYTHVNGDTYVGEYKDGKRNGQGTYTYPDGEKYAGEYKDGKKNGQGTYTFASGDKYTGESKDGKRYGLGTYTHANGTIRSGYFMNNEFVFDICKNIGLKKGSDPFGLCVVSLINEINEDD